MSEHHTWPLLSWVLPHATRCAGETGRKRCESLVRVRRRRDREGGGDQEGDGELLAESEEVTYECGARQKFPILFDDPVVLAAGRWYIAWARVSGPSSDCGSSGQTQVTTEDQIQFHFKSSKKSNNGTDVNAGQLPQLLYKLITNDTVSNSHRRSDPPEPVCILSSRFARAVTSECFQALISLIKWSWSSFKTGIIELLMEENDTRMSWKNQAMFSSSLGTKQQCPDILNLDLDAIESLFSFLCVVA